MTYGTKTGIPTDADLAVEEILPEENGDAGTSSVYGKSYEEYVSKTENALGMEEGSAGYIRLFDIKIVDQDDHSVKYQPAEGTTVDVRIELADKEASEEAAVNTQVVHFADGADAGDLVENFDVEGNAVCFEAEGFSAYAIVEGPAESAGDWGWKKVANMEEFDSRISAGLCVGHSDGFYFTGEIYYVNNTSRTGIKKTETAQNVPTDKAVPYFFEKDDSTGKYYAYCLVNGVKNYVKQSGNSLSLVSSKSDASSFTIERDSQTAVFTVKSDDGYYWNQQGDKNGKGFAAYNNNNQSSKLNFWYYVSAAGDPYDLDGMSYGFMNWSGEPSGKALMANAVTSGALEAKSLTVMCNTDNTSQLFIPSDSDITMWTFEWAGEDCYYLKAAVEGEEKYLSISEGGAALVGVAEDPSAAFTVPDSCRIRVIPGSGSHSGQICLKSGSQTMTYSGSLGNGFSIDGEAGSEWLNLVTFSDLTSEYFMTHSAQKGSVSDPGVTNGSKVIIYTRVWNETLKRYEFYAVDYDGSFVPLFESGDYIQWVGGQFNTLLWDFVEYYWEGTNDPNYYYELYNEYSEKYIAPQVTGGQILSDSPIGIHLNGRRNGYHYSSIVAWDEDNYAYAGLKADVGDGQNPLQIPQIISCPLAEAQDFYFAIVQDISTGDALTTVSTVDNNLYGIQMKLIDFDSRAQMGDFLGSNNEASYEGNVPVIVQGLLSTNLIGGYPTVMNSVGTNHERTLSELFSGAKEVNHLFIQSTYDESGYFEFDSTQNFASLKGKTDGDFTVYKELGTYDSGGNKSTLKHGQFFPFNDLKPGVFAVVNGKNLYSALADFRSGQGQTGLLSDLTPRKYEQLYSIEYGNNKANPYFGMELEASFTQTPSGHDDWDHDIIFEFTGDDDFWLYVDGELVIDLGGIHSAVPGSVNFATGDVSVNGIRTNLREVFESNFRKRNPNAQEESVTAFLSEYFEEGKSIFKEYTQHTMKIFYMERGAGASNLHMRFNLASVRPGHVLLKKELDGVSEPASFQAEFPFQIYYTLPPENDGGAPFENLLTNNNPLDIRVYYKDTVRPVAYRDLLTIDGVTYNSVFMLKPGEVADIAVPNDTIQYRIVECGVNGAVYDSVTVKEDSLLSTVPSGTIQSGTIQSGRYDHSLLLKPTNERPKVTYVNHVDPNALRTLTFEKVLYKEDGLTQIHYAEDSTLFNFRLYMGTEHGELEPASMQAYHVKNNLGEYCKWDASLETPGFASLGNGKTDFSQLSLEEKQSATFHTSLNGAISKIPVDFTVEIQEVLAGTRYRLEERESEIPDGYSLQKYILYENESGGNSVDENDSNDGDSNESGADLSAGGQDIVNHYVVGTVDSNPHIKVCNLKGFGLRINKEWSDKEYMEDRAPTYFAVFTDDGNGNLTLVGDASGPRDQSTGADSAANADSIPGTTEPAVFSTVRQLTYGTNPQTLYWYFEHLPVLDVSFDKYVVREVTLGNSNPTVDENGYVTNYGSVTVVGGSDQNGTLTLSGRQIGQEENSPYTYTVTYEDGSIERDANVHVFSAKNSRPGVKLYKKDGDKPLANAKFRLSKGDTLIGEFTSDADGLVTEAFLQPGETYTYELMEMVSPQSYQGLQGPIQLTLVGSTLNVVDENGTGQRYTPETGASMPTYTIQNTPYEFQVVKADQSGHPLPGVIFALHRQKTVDGHTGIEVEPESGYENLVTGADGIVPKLDKTLPPGTWELRETGSLPAYLPLSGHIRFTISDTGVISLVDGNYPADEVELTSYKTDVPKKITYTMTITNRTLPMTLKKEDDAGHPLAGARFTLMMLNTSGVWINLGSSGAAGGLTETGAGSVIDMSTCTETSLPVLTNGLYCLEEQIAPEGYVILKKYVYFTVQDGIITLTDETGTALGQADPQAVLSGNSSSGYTLTIKNSPGAALPATGGAGTRLFTVLGSILVMFAGVILWRKRRLFVER